MGKFSYGRVCWFYRAWGTVFAGFGRFAGLEHTFYVVSLKQQDTYSEGRRFPLKVLIVSQMTSFLRPLWGKGSVQILNIISQYSTPRIRKSEEDRTVILEEFLMSMNTNIPSRQNLSQEQRTLGYLLV